jgi:hypothetical protein
VEDIAAFNALMMTGQPTIAPRIADVPVRLPFPRVLKRGESIFEKQKGLRNSPFERRQPPARRDEHATTGA